MMISHHPAVVSNYLPHHGYPHYFHFPHCLPLVQVQEDVLGELDVCGEQDNSDHWLILSHDPVAMDGLSRMGDLSGMPVVCTKTMLTQAINIWW